MQGEKALAEVERALGVRFPSDYRTFIVSSGGVDEFVGPAGDFLSIYAPDRLIEMNEAADAAERFPGGVIIGGDGGREMLTYDFRRQPPPLVLLDITAEGWDAAIHQAPSFAALMAEFPRTGWRFDAADDAAPRRR
ncbi:SMI1/KNR4 family protein [Micromonospora sp. MA102]|uniref:SMI1/KNR4 family protein n=1 Tax=Micromonospora sp. MA102 TaxID=2952755 RepID=UPI0021C615EB|nr:SMI1/KNR4 family protein [Micromonospora sp. MA102]